MKKKKKTKTFLETLEYLQEQTILELKIPAEFLYGNPTRTTSYLEIHYYVRKNLGK